MSHPLPDPLTLVDVCDGCGTPYTFQRGTRIREVCKICIPQAQSMSLPIYSDTALSKQVGGGHYKSLAIQPAEYCQRNRLPYCESSVVRYVTRHREENGRQDIEKAIHCLELLLELEYPRDKHA